jgi:cytosine/adenosine deaminase-related metal-dependent hydrolase
MSNDRLTITNGYVLSMDSGLGELSPGDVLVEGGGIAAVGVRLEAGDAEVIDASGCVVMPGFVDTHRHTWQTALRAICADWTLSEYFRGIRQTFSPRYTAQDVYAGNYVGALEALDAGVTTILDFSHCNNSPAHADAALQGLRDAHIRAVFGYGYFPSPVEQPVFADQMERIADARRVKSEHLSSDDGLVTMGIALTEVGLLPFDLTRAEVESGRELDALVVTHTGCVWGSALTHGIKELDAHGLLGADQIHVHCNALTDRDFDRLARSGAKVSSSPETEIQMGMGHPVIGRALEHGMHPSLSCDVVSLNSGDMFTQMRLGLQFERCMRNDAINARGEDPATLDLTVRDALRWATLYGAEAMGLDQKIGSLTPGKQADLIVVGGDRLNLTPMAEPVGAMVVQANSANVRDVLVAGRVVKRDGRLVGVDPARVRRLAYESRERVFERVLADGPVLPPEQPGFAEALREMAKANLASAGVETR